MIKVKVTSDKQNKIQRIEIKGHARSAPHGEDLVCAAVSAVITGGLNSLKNPKQFKMELREGYSLVEVTGQIDEFDENVLSVILTQLKTIAEDNQRFINIMEN